MKIKMKPGHEGEFPMVNPKQIDPAYWVDEDSMGQSFAEMRNEDIKKGLKTDKGMRASKASVSKRKRL